MKIQYALFALAVVSAPASAQTLKPGLWEVTNNMTSSSGEMEKAQAQMQEQMRSMPPEQRRMMEEMMAKHGVQMGAGGRGGMTSRQCLTKEMVERMDIPHERSDCRTTRNERSGNTVKFAFSCSKPPSSGEGQYTIASPEAYAMKMVVRTSIEGKSEMMNMDATGKWLGADCGNLKPVQPPRK